MWPNPHVLVTFTGEIINGKLQFLCAVNKSEILQEIEKKLEKDDYRIYKKNYTNTNIIMYFMSANR